MTTPSASPPPLFPLLSRIPYPYPSVGFEAVELAEAEPPWPAVHPVATNVEVRTKVAAADVLGVEERHIACEKMCVTSRDIFASYFSVCFLLAFSGSKMIKT